MTLQSVYPAIAYAIASYLIHGLVEKRKKRKRERVQPDCSHLTDGGIEITETSVIYNWPWNVLEVEPYSDIQDIKKAYRTKIKQCHPDVAGPEYHQRTIELNEAYREAIRKI